MSKLNNVCRICLSVTKDLVSLCDFDNTDTITQIGLKFTYCFQLKIFANECYPNHICHYCEQQLNVFSLFKLKAEETHLKLKNLIKTENTEADKVKLKPEILSTEEYIIEQDTFHANALYDDLEITPVLWPIIQNASDESLEVKLEEQYLENEDSNESIQYQTEYLNEDDSISSDNFSHNFDDSKQHSDEITVDLDIKKSINIFVCNICGKTFRLRDTFEAHQNTHKGLHPYTCKLCKKTFNQKSNYLYHMQSHTNHRPEMCHLCDKAFKNKADLAVHIRVHKNIRKYVCNICDRRFRSASHMTNHRYSHDAVKRFKCEICQHTFQNPKNLRTHMNTIHSNTCNYKCNLCAWAFKRKHHLDAHRRIHLKDVQTDDCIEFE